MRSSTAALLASCVTAVTLALPANGEPATTLGADQTSAGKSSEKVETVAVGGCLKEGPGETWELTGASEPVISTANAPSAQELAELPKSGTNRFQLIGVAIFGLPAHRNHAVLVKALLVKGTPVSRLNITSVTMVSETCPAR